MFTTPHSIIESGITLYVVQVLRYVIIAGGAFLAFYVIWKKKFAFKRIRSRFPSAKKMATEVYYSFLTFGIFSLMGMFILYLDKKGFTLLYHDISNYGWFYFIASILIMLLLHDTYFYWTHRLMHHPAIFRHVHRVHHLSVNPTPLASFSFHPFEAVIESGILLIIVFVMPAHPLAIFFFLLIMTIINVLGHLGYEFYPSGFLKHPLGRLNNTSVHHNMHHQYFNCNYGLYFNWWDRLMGTNHPDYYATFAKIANRKSCNDVKEN